MTSIKELTRDDLVTLVGNIAQALVYAPFGAERYASKLNTALKTVVDNLPETSEMKIMEFVRLQIWAGALLGSIADIAFEQGDHPLGKYAAFADEMNRRYAKSFISVLVVEALEKEEGFIKLTLSDKVFESLSDKVFENARFDGDIPEQNAPTSESIQ
jgi:hypothetical protein